MHDALTDAVSGVDHRVLKAELADLIPNDVQQVFASAGIRDEQVFPAPSLLFQAPYLVGYYRLLLGIPQKSFYGSSSGMAQYKSMETKGVVTAKQEAGLSVFCSVMAESLVELVRQISPLISPRDVQELPILTFGAQLQGANNNVIGRLATTDVFLAVREIVRNHIIEATDQQLVVRNASERRVRIILAGDPDIRIEEEIGGGYRKAVAIEIKGGSDKSNAHNRAGEAEKSHQKARNDGFRDFWTIIAKKGLDAGRLSGESPTTNEWFDIAHILARQGDDWQSFVHAICSQVGIPISESPSQKNTRPLE